MSDARIDPPNPRCDSCGDELTDDEMDFGTDEGGQMCNPCYRSENEDPDARLGGHDNPYPDEGDDPRIGVDCFETAMWNAYPPTPYNWED